MVSSSTHLYENRPLRYDTCNDSLLSLRRKECKLLLHEVLKVVHCVLATDCLQACLLRKAKTVPTHILALKPGSR